MTTTTTDQLRDRSFGASLVTISGIHSLTQRFPDPCVSLLVPMLKKGDTAQNAIRFKNALRDAEKGLLAYGLKKSEATEFLSEPTKYLADNYFWEYQNLGLAVYLCPAMQKVFSLPLSPEPVAVVNDRFYIKPLLPIVSREGRFFVLALSQKKTRLFEGTSQSFHEWNLEFPSLQDFETEETHLQHHPIADGRHGNEAQFHGQGAGKEEKKTDILKLFSRIDRLVSEFLKNSRAPLVLAGVDFLHSLYEEVNTFPRLIAGKMTTNIDRLKNETVHEEAMRIVVPYLSNAQREAVDRYRKIQHSGKTSADFHDVLRSAFEGKINVLLVAERPPIWGMYEPDTDGLIINEERLPGDEDLLDVASLETMRHGGSVFVVEENTLGDHVPIAAVYRY